MRFAYYDNLSRREQAIYRRSDDVRSIPLGPGAELRALIPPLEAALAADALPKAQLAAQALIDAIGDRLQLPPVRLRVLEVRPREADSELHGL